MFRFWRIVIRTITSKGALGSLFVLLSLLIYRCISPINSNLDSVVLVSIVVPCFNVRADWFEQTIRSIKDQTLRHSIQVIIVDDGSESPLEESRLWALGHHVASVQIYRHKHNLGLAATRNTGAALARGRYLAFLDPDDFMAPTAIEKLLIKLHYLESQPNNRVAFVYPAVVHFERNPRAPISIEAVQFDKNRLLRENFIPSFALLRRDLYLKVGGMCEGIINHYEDYDYWLRLVSAGLKGSLLDEPLFYYRRHAMGLSVQSLQHSHQWKEELIKANPVAFGDIIVPADDPSDGEDYLPDTQSPCHRSLPSSLWGLWLWRTSPGYPWLFFPGKRSQPLKLADAVTTASADVIMIVPWLQVGGADYYDLDVLTSLRKMNVRVLVLVDETGRENCLAEKFESLGSEIFYVSKLLHPGCDQDETDSLFDYFVTSRKPRFVYVRNSMNGYRLAQRKAQGTIRFIDVQHLWTVEDKLGWEYTTIPFVPYLHHRIVVSDNLKSRMLDIYRQEALSDADSIKVLRPSIDMQAVSKLSKVPECKDGRKTLVFIGRLQEQKDPLGWIQIAARLAKKDPSMLFLMIGDGYLRDQVQQAIKQNSDLEGRILLVGSLERAKVLECLNVGIYRDNYDVLRLSPCKGQTVLLLPSRNEGLPMVILEAAGLGIPIVTLPVGAIEEVASFFPQLVTVVADKTVETLVQAVLAIFQDSSQTRAYGGIPEVFTAGSFFNEIKVLFS